MDRTTTIRSAIKDVETALLISIALVIMVVFIFLRNGRATFIPGVVVPVSLIGTFGVMYLLDYSLDNLSLMALTISTGFVVDDAIVVIENITRYLEQGLTPMAAAFRGASEIGFTVVSMSTSLIAVISILLLRFEARKNSNGGMILYDDQDETLWNDELISKGAYFLHKASQGNKLSKYHLEASIAYWYTIKKDTKEKWESILQLYNQLLQLEYSPIAALNRTYALSKANGKEYAIIEAEKLQLTGNHFYFTLLGELYTGIDDDRARQNFKKAFSIAKTQTDKETIQKKINKVL